MEKSNNELELPATVKARTKDWMDSLEIVNEKGGIPYLHAPVPAKLIEHPRYKLKAILTSERGLGEEKETVKVKYYIHERTFKERLKTIFIVNEKSSVRWQFIRLIVRMVSCFLYVTRAAMDREPSKAGCDGCPSDRANSTRWCCPMYDLKDSHNHTILLWVTRPIEIWSLQVAVSVFLIFDGLLTAFLNYKGSLLSCFSRYIFVDFITAIPYVVSIFLPDLRNLTTLTFLHCWVAKNSLETLLNDLHRKKLKHHSALSQKMLIVGGSVVCLLFTSVCGIQHLERAHHNWTMFESLWFVVVTFSTVGYGDITPKDWIARTWVMIMIALALMILPGELEELAFLLVCKQREGTVYSRVLGGGERHVVVCATTFRSTMMIDFLNEFYAEAKNQDVQVVLLSPSDIGSDLRILLQVPLWAHRVTYLKGSALNDEDLERAKVIDAAGVFILSDRGNPDIDAADHHTIMRTWAIQDFAPATPLYVQILKPENKFHVSFAEHVVCEHEIKHAMLASNCVCPGISTLVTLLLHTLREQKGSSSEKWQDMYGRCAGNEIYHITLGDSKMFRRYAYKSFTHAAYHSFRRYGVTLIGIRTAAANSPILLNPGPTYHLAYDDVCFYIAITSEEDMALEELKKGEGTKRRELKREQQWGSFISVIDHSEEERAIEQAVELRRMEENGDPANGSFPKAKPEDENGQESSNKNDIKEGGSDMSELPFPLSDASDLGSEQDAYDGSMAIQSVPRYQIGVPSVTAYVGRTPLKCHLLPEPKPFCCLELTRICSHSKGEDLSKRLSGAVIVASPIAGAGLYNFILPLRAYYRPKCTLKPLVLLLSERPGQSFLEAVCSFPLLYFSVGSFQNVDDLLRAGILESEKVVLTDQRHGSDNGYSEEEHMVDSYTLVGVQTIFRLFPRTFLIIELSHPTNMKFVKFNVDITSLEEEAEGSKTSLRHTIKRRYKESQSRKDHLSYMFREPFAAGNVFSASMIDTLLYQTFVKEYMITLIAQLLGCEQAPGSGYLTQMVITPDKLWIGTYGRLFQRLCTTTYDIPIGLYRTIKDHGSSSAFGKQPEDRDIYGIVANRLKRLGLKGQPDMSSRPLKSCSIVNPPPHFQLEEGDLIYLIRRSPTVSTSSELVPPQSYSTPL